MTASKGKILVLTRNTHFKYLIFLILGLVLFGVSCDSKVNKDIYADQAIEETLIPVRPGLPGEQPFWNGLSMLHILLQNPDQLFIEDTIELLDALTESADMEIVNQIIGWIQQNKPLPLSVFQKFAQNKGCTTQWWVAGPYPKENQQSNMISFFPEKGINFSQNQVFGKDNARWQLVQPLSIHGIVPFGRLFGKHQGIAYAYTEISLPEPGEFVLKIDSNDGVACWVNSELVHSNLQIGRALKIDEDVFSENS
jgi:hypothetical protein